MSESMSSPSIEILEPRDQTQVPANYVVNLRASASAGSKDLDSRIRWRSNRDGFLGRGGDIAVTLTAGEHTLRAVVGRRKDKASRSSTTKSRTSGETESQTDSEDTAKDTVTVQAVPVDYSGGDT